MAQDKISLHTASDVVQLLQLTDTHLCASPGGKLLGVDTDLSLQAVIALARRERPAVDAILATGDLSDQGAESAYKRLVDYFDGLCPQHYWLPGNHDDRSAMVRAAGEQRLPVCLETPHWLVVMLDSQVPGEVGGELGAEQLARLGDCLERARSAQQHVLVCLHHQPVPVGCDWLDDQMVADADALFSVLDRYQTARGVLWGHVHQSLDHDRNGVALMASPSTCVQFAPGQVDFKADTAAPGYRWLELHPDGRIETGISRVTDVVFDVDTESGGYL
jgi:Icc protein